MRHHRSARRAIHAVHIGVVAALVTILLPVAGSSRVAHASPTPWVPNGPGEFTSDSDGSTTPAQMTYDNHGVDPTNTRFSEREWSFSTTAASTIADVVPYFYTGFHAYFHVTVHIDAFVTHNGVTTTTSLAADGPTDCCIAPSGGFTYSGTHLFDVEAGDTYGFSFGGANFDGDPRFNGTLTLAESPYTSGHTVASNTSWITALPLTTAGADGALLQPGEARWYKFPVQPDSQVQVDLTNLDQNFDLTMFRDIGQAFTTLTTTQDLTKLSAQFAGDAFSPSIYSPSIYCPSIYSPSIYSPSIYSPSIYSPSDEFLTAFSSAQTRSLIGVSAHENAESESIRSATWNNTGDFYVRVQGRNGASSPTKFHLGLSTSGGPCAGLALDSFGSMPTIAGVPGTAQTVILTDSSRMPQASTARPSLDQLAARTGGVVVDVITSPRIDALNNQADANAACPYAKNLVAEAIRAVVNSYRDSSDTLQYVVIAGGDTVIPFFRYADFAGIGPESDYIPPVQDGSAAQAGLRRNYVLGQDAYGAVADLDIKGATLPVPDLAVGRLVETAPEIVGMINAYLGLADGVLPTPTSSLVTGYDFLTSAADAVQTNFAAGLGSNGRADSLITNQGVPTTTTTQGTPSRTTSWTATDLANALFGSRHDLVFLAGHFSANNALAADYQTSLATTDLDAHPNLLTNSLVVSAGCHTGYNILDSDGVPGVTLGLDWAEEMAKQRATFVGGTGYQYADTDFLAYSAKLYTLFSGQLRNGTGAVAIGQALVGAKQDYLAGVTSLTGIDQKALIESTLYGLPMTGLNLPSGRTTDPATGPGITPVPVAASTPGDVLGLKTASVDVTPTLTPPAPKAVLDTAGNPTGATFRWLTGRDGVQSEPAVPALPKQIDDVTSTTGEVLRGVGFVSGTYTDTPGVTPLTGAPATEQNGVHTSFASPSFFPQKLATVNYFGALDGNGTDGRTRLITTPAQYRSDSANGATNTERAYSHLGLQLFYSSNTTTYSANTPALAAPPSISDVADTFQPGDTAVTVSAHITGDPSAGIQKAWITYTAESGPLHGAWQSADLVQDTTDSTLWTATFALPSGQTGADVRYIVQAANGVGLVGLDNNLGDGYTPGVPVGGTTPPATEPTSVALDPTPATGAWGTNLDVAATLTGAPAGSSVTFTLGSASSTSAVDGSGRAHATLLLQDAVGDYTLSASYAGDVTHLGSSEQRAFGITTVPTSVTVAAGTATTISAVLTRASPTTPLPQQTVYFTVTGPVSKQITAITDPQGRARVQPGALPNGTYSVSAAFLGTPTLAAAASAPTQVTIDRAGPTVSAVVLTPPSIITGTTTTLTASVSDPAGVARVEYFVGADPGVGAATTATLASGSASATFGSTLVPGTYTVGVRALDTLGNWSATTTATLTVIQMGVSVSTNVNRSAAVDFAGATVSGSIAVFATPAPNANRVAIVGFYIDDPNLTRLPYWVQLVAPYDLAGTAKNGTASLFDTRRLLNGAHTLTIVLVRQNGAVERRTVSFTVNNPAPTVPQRLQVSTTATRANPVDLNGRTLSGSVAIFVAPSTSVKSVAFWLDTTNLTVAPRSVDTAAQFDFNGTASNGRAVLFNVGTLSAGSHRIAAQITYTNGTTAVITSTFTRG